MDKEAFEAAKEFLLAFNEFIETPVIHTLCFNNPNTASDPRVQRMLSAHELAKAHMLIAESRNKGAA